MSEPKPFHERVAERLVEQLKSGMAPWQRPWVDGVSALPMNPLTGVRYKGINTVHLLMQGRGDPRWMTYRQAESLGAQVQQGERGTSVQYWKFTEEQPQYDGQGKPVLDPSGKPSKVTVVLERPRVFYATVFNAEQMQGLPALEHKPRQWNPIERAETILKNSGAKIEHGGDRAYYNIVRDLIRLPSQEQFPTAAAYYATALHELGHWTGHPERLDRDLAHPFGSEAYAREELRAEIASMIIGDELGLGHDPSQHAAYVGHWIRSLEEDPLEIFRAASAAEKIRDHVLTFEQQQDLAHKSQPPVDAQRDGVAMSGETMQQKGLAQAARVYLAVPYGERGAAKAAGARWDRAARSWYAGPGAALERLARWLPERVRGQQLPAMDPRDEFTAALTDMGCVVKGEHPIMDGEKHRLPVEGDRKGEKGGFYIGHLDGHPAGYIKNHRTGVEIKWKSKGYKLDEATQVKLRAEAAQKQEERAANQRRVHEVTASRLQQQLGDLTPVTFPTAYMQSRGIGTHPGTFTDEGGKTYVPATDADGKLWTVQSIDSEGKKRFAQGSRKHGCFHAIGGISRLAKAEVLVIAEGYATAATASELLGKPAVAAFDAGNLLAVAQALHAKFPDKPVLIVGDDDQAQERARGNNPGRQKAEQAAKAVGGVAVTPIFAPAEQQGNPKGFSDFNDLAVRSVLGRDGAVSQLRHMYEKALSLTKQALPRAEAERVRPPQRRARAI